MNRVAEIGYRAHTFDAAKSEELERRERRDLLWRLLVAGFGAMQVMMYAVPAYLADGDMSADVEQLMRVASLALTLPVVLWSAVPFYRGAWRGFAARRVGMDVPVAIAIVVALAASLTATIRGAGDVYYDSITLFVLLLLAARYLEMSLRARAVRAQQRLAKLAPAIAERLLERAQSEKPRIAELADRVAQWFVAALLVIAVAGGIAWYAIDASRAVWIVVAVLVIACPCALSLATPAALTAATGTLHACGMLVTRGHALETLARATHVVFDKTGTLTRGHMGLIGVLPARDLDPNLCLAIAAGVESGSEHAIARALSAAADKRGPRQPAAANARNHPGQGMQADVDGVRYRVGSLSFVAELHGQPLPPELTFTADDVSVAALGDERGWLALFTLGDALRRDARQVVRELKARGRQVCLLSGDRVAHVGHVARELGIGIVRGAAAPQAKLEFVRELQARGAVVAMVGDGINDAPVLAQAQVSIAMGSGTELAQVNADMVLLSERLQDLLEAFDIAARTVRVVRQNFAWVAAYNAVAVPLALAGWVTPLVAAIGMSASSLLVVLNALRLARFRSAAKAASAGPAARMAATSA